VRLVGRRGPALRNAPAAGTGSWASSVRREQRSLGLHARNATQPNRSRREPVRPFPCTNVRARPTPRLTGPKRRRAAPPLRVRVESLDIDTRPPHSGRLGHSDHPSQQTKRVRPPLPAGLVESIYHPKGVAQDTSRKGGLR
jgi:hypothetical protein